MDLNLIRVFVAVYEEGTVTAAARRLHMAQPSVTQALHRLRRETGEPLFNRKGRGITPTRAAARLYSDVGEMPVAAEAAVKRISQFTPATTRETFRLALTDLGQILFLPALGPALADIAPHSGLDVVPLDITTASADLFSGRVDVAIASTPLAENLQTSVIRHDVYWCVARQGRFGTDGPDVDDLSSSPRIVVKDSTGHTVVESNLPSPPPGSIYLPAFSAIPAVVAASDLIAFVPQGVIPLWSTGWNLESWPMSERSFTSVVRAYTAPHPASSASAWFREWAIETLRTIPAE